ncbi:serine/arginine repetitive matrix protein 1-like [Hemicordylus capensis]|uniref:serine/arginine repetitive matrix protein 1-like n=1 Tax=Hemicordylus capensis TaxID=884348 RepID=UPI00230365F1|nr:serine/arginine repetitive matrix protein 1-like [Hemicordylus capensis]
MARAGTPGCHCRPPQAWEQGTRSHVTLPPGFLFRLPDAAGLTSVASQKGPSRSKAGAASQAQQAAGQGLRAVPSSRSRSPADGRRGPHPRPAHRPPRSRDGRARQAPRPLACLVPCPPPARRPQSAPRQAACAPHFRFRTQLARPPPRCPPPAPHAQPKSCPQILPVLCQRGRDIWEWASGGGRIQTFQSGEGTWYAPSRACGCTISSCTQWGTRGHESAAPLPTRRKTMRSPPPRLAGGRRSLSSHARAGGARAGPGRGAAAPFTPKAGPGQGVAAASRQQSPARRADGVSPRPQTRGRLPREEEQARAETPSPPEAATPASRGARQQLSREPPPDSPLCSSLQRPTHPMDGGAGGGMPAYPTPARSALAGQQPGAPPLRQPQLSFRREEELLPALCTRSEALSEGWVPIRHASMFARAPRFEAPCASPATGAASRALRRRLLSHPPASPLQAGHLSGRAAQPTRRMARLQAAQGRGEPPGQAAEAVAAPRAPRGWRGGAARGPLANALASPGPGAAARKPSGASSPRPRRHPPGLIAGRRRRRQRLLWLWRLPLAQQQQQQQEEEEEVSGEVSPARFDAGGEVPPLARSLAATPSEEASCRLLARSRAEKGARAHSGLQAAPPPSFS